jgi:hypothetical protein
VQQEKEKESAKTQVKRRCKKVEPDRGWLMIKMGFSIFIRRYSGKNILSKKSVIELKSSTTGLIKRKRRNSILKPKVDQDASSILKYIFN